MQHRNFLFYSNLNSEILTISNYASILIVVVLEDCQWNSLEPNPLKLVPEKIKDFLVYLGCKPKEYMVWEKPVNEISELIIVSVRLDLWEADGKQT